MCAWNSNLAFFAFYRLWALPWLYRKPTVHCCNVSSDYTAMSFLVLPNTVPYLQEDATNWSNFTTHFREAMLAINSWGHFNGTATCPTPKDATCPTSAECQAIKEWKHEDSMVQGLLSPRLLDCIFIHLINHKTVKVQWD